MVLNIGKNLRALRANRGITQEVLAEHLGVLPQTVSKWERNEGYPDITMLLPLASYFGVTLDELMGRDEAEEERQIAEILRRYDELAHIGGLSGLEDLMDDAYAAHPYDFRIMAKYVDSRVASPSYLAFRDEIEKVSARLLAECTDERLRTETLVNLANARFLFGDENGADEIAEKLPKLTECREIVRIGGADSGMRQREFLDAAMEQLLWWMRCVAVEHEGEERIRMLRDVLAVGDILFPDFDCDVCHDSLASVCAALFREYAKAGKRDNAIKYLKRAFHHAREEDKISNSVVEHTSPFLRGAKYDMNQIQDMYEGNSVQFLIEELLGEEVGLDPAYRAVVEENRPFAVEDKTKA